MITGVALAILLVVISILILCSALFSGLETALFSLKPHQLRRLEEHRAGLSKFIQLFRENPRRVLNMLLLGDSLMKVPLVILCLLFLWEGPLATRIPQWLAASVIFAIVVLFCDLIPKLLALSAPYRLSAIGAFTLQISVPLLDRVGHGLERVSALVVDRLTPLHLRTRQRLSDEELGTLVEMGEEEGALQEEEAEMIHEIIKLGDNYTEKLIAPSFVPETMRALDLLKLFLTHPQGMAVVVDEFGGTEGIITMSDIVEEILSDALPRGDVDLYIEPLEHGKFLVSGNARLDDLSEHLGFQVAADGIDTIGGFVFTRLGYLPPSGTKLEIPRLIITVRRAGRKRIEEVLLEKTTGADIDESPHSTSAAA